MISVKYYECVSVFLFQLSFLRRIILSPVACLAVPYSSTPSKVRFSEKKLLNTKCVLFSLQLLSEIFFILRRIQRDIIT